MHTLRARLDWHGSLSLARPFKIVLRKTQSEAACFVPSHGTLFLQNMLYTFGALPISCDCAIGQNIPILLKWIQKFKVSILLLKRPWIHLNASFIRNANTDIAGIKVVYAYFKLLQYAFFTMLKYCLFTNGWVLKWIQKFKVSILLLKKPWIH